MLKIISAFLATILEGRIGDDWLSYGHTALSTKSKPIVIHHSNLLNFSRSFDLPIFP